ncbi:MAG: ParB/RepB/Spo0J family partition protein [Acidobacteria bacterium]|nr:ParB/RepB/Spo0J family partition protein [Acidobacteriota bacterium]
MPVPAEKTAEVAPETAKLDKSADKRRALGRGLESLLPSGPRPVPASAAAPVVPKLAPPAPLLPSGDEIAHIPLDHIDDNPYQTRQDFAAEHLAELAESIRTSGVVQPVVVRPSSNGRYILVLGERRCRASRLAGKNTVPAIVRKISDQQAAEMTVVENLQRQDLNCLEQATAYARLSRDFGLTQEQIGQRVGVSRESVSNYMRLLKLPAAVLDFLRSGELGFSEARVLLQFQDPDLISKLAAEAVRLHMSVQQIEELARKQYSKEDLEQKETARAKWLDPNVRAAQTELERVLGVRVRINDKKGKGKIVIEYSTLEDFDRVLDMLKGEPN